MNLKFGSNLKKLRREKGMTQDELARVLTLSVKAISRYETDAAYPDIEMLPVIAGFFGTTVDDLIGVSRSTREKRLDEYTKHLRTVTDRSERLEILKRQHAEFPESWSIVSDMVYEMGFLPECLDEMRETVDNGMKNCDEPLWRENMMLFYLRFEPDNKTALTFIDNWASKYDIRRASLMSHRYSVRNDLENLRRISQKKLCDDLKGSFLSLTDRNGLHATESAKNCNLALGFIDALTESNDREKPDMWIDVKLILILRLSNNCFLLDQNEEGFRVLESAVTLFENFFALPTGTILSYRSQRFDCLSAKTKKSVYYDTTEFSGLIAQSMMTDLIYETPIAYINEAEEYIRDMEGFERNIVFSGHTYNILKNAGWGGFMRVKDKPRYLDCLERVKMCKSDAQNLKVAI